MDKERVLVVDDEQLNLFIIEEFLENEDIELVLQDKPLEAWACLSAPDSNFSLVVLDRMMPDLDGMEFLRRMKRETRFVDIPVIMQTAATTHQQTLEGLQAGAYYYLAKPFDQATLQAIVDAAVRDHVSYLDIRQDLRRTTTTMRLLDSGTFHFRTPEEARNLAMLLAHAYPDADRVVTGILELTLNAIEHGNLSIGYKEKSRLIEEDKLEEEIAHRLSSPPYSSRVATAKFSRQPHGLSLHITDQGNGFDWKNYMDFDPERAFDTHGRGIAMANKVSFDQIEYRGNGNQVLTVFNLEQVAPALAV